MTNEIKTDSTWVPRILVVDDVPDNVRVLNNLLSSSGYTVSSATSGQQALRIVQAALPELILLDIQMPDMDGFEVCRQLKNSETTRGIPIIFITGCTDLDNISQGFTFGAVDYVTKPFSSAELLARVSTHLTLRYARHEIERLNAELAAVRAHDHEAEPRGATIHFDTTTQNEYI